MRSEPKIVLDSARETSKLSAAEKFGMKLLVQFSSVLPKGTLIICVSIPPTFF